MSTTLTLAYWIDALLLAALAYCWASVLVQPGMLLAPVQAWVRRLHRRAWFYFYIEGSPGHVNAGQMEVEYYAGHDLDNQWWWAPLWGCFKCVAGQWAFWGYLLLFPLSAYHLLAHLSFVAVTILISILLNKWSQ
ncbi:hypothetical protein [Hymenobacter properus]|uniref:Uncharacterized protein n=1 Tax=Hymenobacter properus TaxID=2791026 RepID=A0A931BFR6_9BACT|nr:hypothetical protein [Hymenobacter properus]MBF9140846.1 hypothetical protein [Hymenobacter properus]MBR7719655.1 hypothetical protein [Microvirga sp. SRT04]